MRLRQHDAAIEIAGMHAMTAVLLAVLLWLGARGRRALLAVGAVTLVLSMLNAMAAYHAFRM